MTDPQPAPDEPGAETPGEQGFLDLLGSVRSLAWMVGPAAPRTVVHDAGDVHITSAPGAEVSFDLRFENRQQTAAPVLPTPSTFRSASGRVWSPDVDTPLVLVPAGQTAIASLALGPAPMEAGTYEGSVQLLGADGDGVPVVVEVAP